MLSEVKDIISPDIINFKNYCPEDKKCFSFLITVLVGPRGEPTKESFDIVVCTPQWLLNKYDESEMILGKDKLIVFKFDMERILERINKLFDNINGKDWDDIAMNLSRIGHWEFENYQQS